MYILKKKLNNIMLKLDITTSLKFKPRNSQNEYYKKSSK